MFRRDIVILFIMFYGNANVYGLLNHGEPTPNVSNLTELWSELNQMKTHITIVEKTNEDLRNKVSSLQTEVEHWERQTQTVPSTLNASIKALQAVHSATVSEITALQGEQIYFKNMIHGLQTNLSNVKKNDLQKMTFINSSVTSLEHRINSRLSNVNTSLSKSVSVLESRLDSKISNINNNLIGLLQSQIDILKHNFTSGM